MAQLEAIRHEIRSISLVNPGPLTRKLVDNLPDPSPQSSVGNFNFQGLVTRMFYFCACL